TLDPEYELFCSMTNSFFNTNMNFLKKITKSINKSILLAVYNEGVICEDGIEIDIEYKTFDMLGSPVEIATFQVDNGTTDSAFNVRYKNKNGVEEPVSTMHIVFPFSSLERSAYFLIDRAIKKEPEIGFRHLPFWATPIQARVIPQNSNSLKDAIKIAER